MSQLAKGTALIIAILFYLALAVYPFCQDWLDKREKDNDGS